MDNILNYFKNEFNTSEYNIDFSDYGTYYFTKSIPLFFNELFRQNYIIGIEIDFAIIKPSDEDSLRVIKKINEFE